MGRAIDALPPRDADSRSVAVLSLGLSRTATLSMKRALEKLGYRTYHFSEIREDGAAWNEALEIKASGKPNSTAYGPDEFQRLLKDWDAVTDAPCACFPDELMHAFPQAKVILSSRDPDAWSASMENAYYRILQSSELKWRLWRFVASFDPVLQAILVRLRLCLEIWTDGDWTNRQKLQQGFLKHNDHVRSVVPQDKLLEWKPQDGWGPLCKFLGKPIPDEPFPLENQGRNAADKIVWPLVIIMPIIRAAGAIKANQVPIMLVVSGLVVAFAYRQFQ